MRFLRFIFFLFCFPSLSSFQLRRLSLLQSFFIANSLGNFKVAECLARRIRLFKNHCCLDCLDKCLSFFNVKAMAVDSSEIFDLDKIACEKMIRDIKKKSGETLNEFAPLNKYFMHILCLK